MKEYGHSSRKSIILSLELHSLFRYLIIKPKKLRQPVTNHIEKTKLQITPRPCCIQISNPQY